MKLETIDNGEKAIRLQLPDPESLCQRVFGGDNRYVARYISDVLILMMTIQEPTSSSCLGPGPLPSPPCLWDTRGTSSASTGGELIP